MYSRNFLSYILFHVFYIIIYYNSNNNFVNAECGKELTEFFQCFRNIFDSSLVAYTRGIEFEEFQQQTSKCFVSSGCKDVKLETRKEILKRSGQPDRLPDDLKKLKECKSKIRIQMRNEIEKCIQKKVDVNFRLPETRKTDYVDFPVDVVIRDDIYIRHILRALHNDSICPENSNVTKVIVCLGKFFDDLDDAKRVCLNPFEEITSRTLDRQKACEINCWKKLGKCSNAMKSMFQISCECNRNITNVEENGFDDVLSKCMPELNKVTAATIVTEAINQVSENTCFQEPENPCTLF